MQFDIVHPKWPFLHPPTFFSVLDSIYCLSRANNRTLIAGTVTHLPL